MDIFELLDNDGFFKPLTSKNKKIYFECIVLLIEKAKELPVLYDSDAKNAISIYLKNSECKYEAEDETENLDAAPPDLKASFIMAKLRECGWVTPKEIGRSGENVANVSQYCRKIIDFLRKLVDRNNDNALSNHIFAMYEIVKSCFDEESARAERPYTNILQPLAEHLGELRNELMDLKDNIAHIMRTVMAFQDINSFGRFLIKDELLEQFFGDYFFIKNNGLIPSQIAYIKNKLRIIAQGELSVKMANDYAALQKCSLETARDKVNADINELQYFLAAEYEENMGHIDARINAYYNLANTRIMLVMSNGTNMESLIDALLSAMKTMDEDKKQEMLSSISDCIRIRTQKYVSRKSYEMRGKKERIESEVGLPNSVMSAEEKDSLTEALLKSKNRFSVTGVNEFLEDRIRSGGELELERRHITCRKDAIMFIAALMYTSNSDFRFAAAKKDGFIEADVATMTNLTIAQK